MILWSRFRSWLRVMLHRHRAETEMDGELRFHIASYTADLIRSGLAPEEAARRARIEFGGLEQTKERCRDTRGITCFETLLQDGRFSLRMLRKIPHSAPSLPHACARHRPQYRCLSRGQCRPAQPASVFSSGIDIRSRFGVGLGRTNAGSNPTPGICSP